MPVVIQDRTSLLLRRPPRTHPYAGVGDGAPGRYYDFKLQPDLIATVLEDFAPHSGEAGVQRFLPCCATSTGQTPCLRPRIVD